MNTASHLQILQAITAERHRQDTLLSEAKIPWNCADPEVFGAHKLAVLAEEFGEVARALLEGNGLRRELVEVAAVAVAWAESLPHELEVD